MRRRIAFRIQNFFLPEQIYRLKSLYFGNDSFLSESGIIIDQSEKLQKFYPTGIMTRHESERTKHQKAEFIAFFNVM